MLNSSYIRQQTSTVYTKPDAKQNETRNSLRTHQNFNKQETPRATQHSQRKLNKNIA